VLLLVLILVLIAFGLLVVALLSGSVLWAWVSVGVSVAAAAVLLVDWLQRRSAVRAGAEAGDTASPPAASGPSLSAPDRDPVAEPVTEVLPTVRAADAPEDAGQAGRDPAADERPDTRETVVMRAFAPSGSAEGPSGAHAGIGPGGLHSSPSVTNASGDPGGAPGWGVAAHAGDGPPSDDGPGSSTTVKVAGTDRRDPTARDEPAIARGVPGRGAPEPAGTAPPPAAVRQDLPPLGPDGAPPEEPRDPAAAAVVAQLDDEVLVVDELPRYHLGGCRSLGGSPVIPLPAREAVELGFTPCAWCTPDRTLGSRHRAPAR
jgi:hypothetical protein